jgi:Cdc6-like AAA superfamily ATPase
MKTILDLLPDYFSILQKEKENSELYKWQAIQHFQENWDINVPDDEFHEMFKRALSKRENLIFKNSFGFLNSLSKEMPREAKDLLSYLYNEEIPLEERIPKYQEMAVLLLPELKKRNGKEKFQQQQDERTISFLLTLHKPDKYYLYKDDVYRWLCELRNEQTREAGKKYLHFTQLADSEFDSIMNHPDTLKAMNYIGTDKFHFDSRRLIIQDILYRTMPKNDKTTRIEFFKILVEEVKDYLETIEHPLAQHVWTKNEPDYRWISVWKNNEIDPYFLHYEIIHEPNSIEVELHPEGSESFKRAFEPFMQQMDSSLHKEKIWHYGLPKKTKGNYHKIVSKTLCVSYSQESEPTTQQIEAVANRLIEFYDLYQSKIENFLKEIKFSFPNSKNMSDSTKSEALNQILYGPPGTGKTYNTINKALEIINDDEVKSLDWSDRTQVKELFDKKLKEGQIVFTTFHQSMSYEDFIEGIKPLKPGDDDAFLKYDIEPGLFKQIANTAKTLKSVSSNNLDWDNVNYYKMSIGGKNRPDIHNWCIENNVVGLSWGGENDLSQLTAAAGLHGWKKYRDDFTSLFPTTVERNRYNIQASFIFNKMKIGDIVVISKGNHIIDAIGKVTGDYYFNDETPTDMFHFREVEWIATDLDASPEKFIDKQISQQSIYEFTNSDVKKEAFEALTSSTKSEVKPYVLIIDEINRGNVSAIFGELITLIEQDKRLGAENELKVTLPYSKEKFGVPPNLYIIGTMNTADRSVEALDTALRRRFSFTEMPPKPELLTPSAMFTRLFYEYKGVDWTDKEYSKKEAELASLLGINTQSDLWKKRIDTWKKEMFEKDQSDLNRLNYLNGIASLNFEVLLNTINKRIEVLLDSDHAVGHSYFIKIGNIEDFKRTMYNNVIPLLQEYFYGDYAKIGAVLGKGFIKEKQLNNAKDKTIFADFDGFEDGDYNEKSVYEIVDYRAENLVYELEVEKIKVSMNFEKAIRLLMNQSISAPIEN